MEAAFARCRDEIYLRAGLTPGVIAVVSARRGEGRTSVAAGLAEAFSRSVRKPVLLVDFDLARPCLHSLLGVPLAPGVSDVLRGDCQAQNALRPIDNGAVHVLTAGSEAEDAGVLLASEATSRLLEHLRDQAAVVIIDAPPLEEGVRTRLLIAAADGTVLVVRADRTAARDALDASAVLSSARGTHVLGVIVNAVPRGRSAAIMQTSAPFVVPAAPVTAARVPRGSESQ